MEIVKTPELLIKFIPSLRWRVPVNEKLIYLTFDDGPTQISTPRVLSHLSVYNARATFFCVGDNIRKHPETFKEIINNGHFIGNHTHNHLNGWETPLNEYLQNIKQCDTIIEQSGYIRDRLLFRPPYGKMNLSQWMHLKRDYIIVMWDILTWDFNPGNHPERILDKILKKTRPGSIVVFHDSEKALQGMEFLLERFLNHFSGLGYRFNSLENLS